MPNPDEDTSKLNDGAVASAESETTPKNESKNQLFTRNIPNSQLTAAQKQAKKNLKAKLKLESRKRKFQVRHDHALKRNDPEGAERARKELETLLQREQELQKEQQQSESSSDEPPEAFHKASLLEQESKKIIEGIYHELQRKLASSKTGEALATAKEHQTEQARELLRNMTKGTQELDMFDNDAALRGYVRQKFIERAMLVASSLSKLDQVQALTPSQAKIYQRLVATQKVVSIGCGPGCDGVGIAAWLKSKTTITDKTTTCPLKEIVMLDWAMPKWEAIVKPLSGILAPDLVATISSGSCNVLGGIDFSDDNQAAIQHCATADIVLCSYLLSETRERWYDFYDSVMKSCCTPTASSGEKKGGTLFLFTDPTAWQLHGWLHRYNSRLEAWCWLDSSMHNEDLQVLEGRVGPAVLLAMTKVP